jgi:hypothetical protein
MAGVAGLLVFLVAHHIWIKPIWSILPAGLLMAAVGGLAVAWSYFELSDHLPSRPWTVPAYMALIAATLAPAAVLGQLRPALVDVADMSIRPGDGTTVAVRFMLELVLTAALVGGVAGRLISHSLKGSIATAAAGVAFALGPGHNIPLLGSTPAAAKGLALLALIVFVSTLILVEGTAWLSRR